MKNIISFVLIIIIAGGAGFALQRYLQQDERQLAPIIPKAVNNEVIGTNAPHFELKDTEGQLSTPADWKGQVLMVNFWATWCPPCKKEMPAFIELQDEYADQGLQIIGIALDDQDSVQDFADTLGVNYPVFAAEYAGIELTRQYGNHIGALPFTAFIARDGKVAVTQIGEISKQQVKDIIQPLLKP